MPARATLTRYDVRRRKPAIRCNATTPRPLLAREACDLVIAGTLVPLFGVLLWGIGLGPTYQPRRRAGAIAVLVRCQ